MHFNYTCKEKLCVIRCHPSEKMKANRKQARGKLTANRTRNFRFRFFSDVENVKRNLGRKWAIDSSKVLGRTGEGDS